MRIAIVDDLETERTQLKTRLARQLRLCGATLCCNALGVPVCFC